ncbi:MAG: di-heme oxidoredictase family protein [Pseudomonadota bacterium]
MLRRTSLSSTFLAFVAVCGIGFWFGSTIDTFGTADVRDDLSASDLTRVLQVTASTSDFSQPERFETMSGGATTHRGQADHLSFSIASQNLSFEAREDFHLGEALFDKLWVSTPASTLASDGLGPLFNARSCAACHIDGGRGHPPNIAADHDHTSFVTRLARPVETEAERVEVANLNMLSLPDPVYGHQLQDRAVPGLVKEGKIDISYEEISVSLADGTIVNLRKPTYSVVGKGYGKLGQTTTVSPRVAPAIPGLGLIEAIHEADILALADPTDRDGNGISGRPALARGENGEITLGRFGWKAEHPTLDTQNAAAFANDIGISTDILPAHRGDCTEAQLDCMAKPTGVQYAFGESEAPGPILDLVTFYTGNIAVPARRDVGGSDVLRGKELFYTSGCASCHTPKFVTSRDAENPEHRFQLIWPYSDFLLHDMGEALADDQPIGVANGREWRTPPLWGIGLTEMISGHTYFLHDGRARNLNEAILWHGGEAQASRDEFAAMEKQDRDALLRFLESL